MRSSNKCHVELKYAIKQKQVKAKFSAENADI